MIIEYVHKQTGSSMLEDELFNQWLINQTELAVT